MSDYMLTQLMNQARSVENTSGKLVTSMKKDRKTMDEIRAEYGLVVYNTQLVEQLLVYMIFAAKLDHKHQMNKINIKELFGNCFNHTLDKLKHDIRDHYHLSSTDIDFINRFLKIRSGYSFKYFSNKIKSLASKEGQLNILKELENASLVLNKINRLLKEKLDDYLKEHKLYKEHINRLVERAFLKNS